MEVILDIEGGNIIPIEIFPIESVRQIKERVQAYLQIPFSHQNLFFNGQLLQDWVSIWETPIKHGSRIKLVVSTDVAAADLPPPPPHLSMLGYTDHGSTSTKLDVATEAATNLPLPLVQEPPPPPQQPPLVQEPSPPPQQPLLVQEPPPPPPRRITLNLKIPTVVGYRIPIEMDREDTVKMLKEKILAREELKGLSMDKIVLRSHLGMVEYLDDQILKDCALTLNHEINVFLKTFLLLSSRSRTPGKLMVNVIPKSTVMEIAIEVNPTDKVSVLRNELEKLHQMLKFRLPKDGAYFFLHEQTVMFEDESFLSHQVKDGDAIETSDGIVQESSVKPPTKFAMK